MKGESDANQKFDEGNISNGADGGLSGNRCRAARCNCSCGIGYFNPHGPETLATLPGIGSVKADAIVSFREENGPFASIDGLLAVPGIGPRLLESVRGLIAIPSR